MDFIDGVRIYVVVDAWRIELLQSVADLFFLCELEEVFKSIPLLVTLINNLSIFNILFHTFMSLPMLLQHLTKVLLLVRPVLTLAVLCVLRAGLRDVVTGLDFGRLGR